MITLDWDPDRTDRELVARLCVGCFEQLPPTFEPEEMGDPVYGGLLSYWSGEDYERRIAEEELADIKARFLDAVRNDKPMILPPFWSYDNHVVDWQAESRATNEEVKRIVSEQVESWKVQDNKDRQPDGQPCYCDMYGSIVPHWHGWAPGIGGDPPWTP